VIRLGLILALVTVPGLIFSQSTFNILEESTMTVSGTSTIHSWTSQVNTIEGNIELKEGFAKKGKLKNAKAITSVKITIPVNSIKSPRGATMDGKTYKALKHEQFPNIELNLNKTTIISLEGNNFSTSSSGTLIVAGKEKMITLDVKGTILTDGKYSFSGSYKMKMKDYDMVPPTAMFGQIVTGDEVTIAFDLIVSK
jgi:hypothetical protein